MQILFSMISGLIFGLGLLISGMTQPEKVVGFLDISRLWDPSLLFVMAGAISVSFFAFRRAGKGAQPIYAETISLPVAGRVDMRLVAGAVLFGAGWGLAGICPGPALVLLGSANLKGAVFFIAMLAGMYIFQRAESRT
ncbi:DUF6691 family protein [Pantoea agglomerans]|uniref:DUF6691 family protein n=1 Tax=Enterobacter agglomerans TaxID=549 RepID=UPI003C7D0389